LRFRFALVDAKLPNASINTLATYTRTPAVWTILLTLDNGVGYFAGTATAEGYALDANSGTLVWEGVNKRGGTTAAIENTFNTWLDVHHAFQAWTNELVTRYRKLGSAEHKARILCGWHAS
jgi:hypothetical protein